jgi:hypothetical protein
LAAAVSGLAVLSACSSSALHVTPPLPSGAVEANCARLGDYLPAKLEKLSSRVVEPKSPLTHAWGSPAIVLRCGVGRPAGYDPTSSQLAGVNDVSWFEQSGSKAVVWTAIRPGANVQLTVPRSYSASGAYLVDLADPLKQALP